MSRPWRVAASGLVALALVTGVAGCGGGGDDPVGDATVTAGSLTEGEQKAVDNILDGITEGLPDADEPTTLNGATTVGVARKNLTIARYCISVIRDGAASPALERQVLTAVDDLIALTRSDPEAVYAPGGADPVTMRQFLGDVASQFENGSCAPTLASQIDRVLRTLPPQ